MRLIRDAFNVALDAFYTFLADDGWAIASHIALSALMALFPFLIVITSLAGVFGSKELADRAAEMMLETWPTQVADALSGEIHNVLTQSHSGVFTIGVVLALYFASNGVESLRVGLNRIYTRTGDDGTTALGSGERRPKYDLRVSAYGTVDETNAVIGVARLYLAQAPAIDAMLGRVQNDLFDLGADLAVPQREGKAERLRVLATQVERLEHDIDALNADLAPLNSFILPGGTPAAAHLHLARTVCRRAERMVVELASQPNEPVSDAAVQYLNRLSDFLFVAGRAVNDNGARDVLWVPGQNR